MYLDPRPFSFDFFFNIELHKLFILEINPLSVASFANILSHFEGCLFVYGFLL